MKASPQNPFYTVYIVSGNTKYNITSAIEGIEINDEEKQMAKSVTIQIMDAKSGDRKLSSIINVRDRVFVYADDGEKSDEVFRGFIWTRGYKESTDDHKLAIKCYDQLIYLQESEDSQYFSSGKQTKDVMASICKSWGITLQYSYESIKHSKLPLRGTLSDMITSDILDLVKKDTGKKYVITSEKDVMYVKTEGQNKTVYNIKAGENAISTTSETTMDGMVTQVKIVGKADNNERRKVEATVKGDTDKYGTLQKVVSRDGETSLSELKKEANTTIKEDGKPKWESEVVVPDIPWIRKGDKVKVEAGDISKDLIAVSINRDIDNSAKKMTLTLKEP